MLIFEEVLDIRSRYQDTIGIWPVFHVVDEFIVVRELEIKDIFPSESALHRLCLLELISDLHCRAVGHFVPEEWTSRTLRCYPDEVEHKLDNSPQSE